MHCAEIRDQELLERYLARGLTEAEQAAVELHFFECAACFEELETLRALRQELSRLPEPRPAEIAAPFHRRRSTWALAAAAALVVAALVLWSLGHHPPKPVGPPVTGKTSLEGLPTTTSTTTAATVTTTSSSTPSTPSTQANGPLAEAVPPETLARLRELARFEPPAYAPVELRGPEDEAQRLFRQAMRHYQDGDYAAALPGLRQAAAKDPEAANVAFFLGACDLLTGRTDAGIRRLRQVVALGDTPYLEEAHLLLAKAYLWKEDTVTAKEELRLVIQSKGDFLEEAKGLLKKLAELS